MEPVIDTEGHITSADRIASQLAGHSAPEIVGRDIGVIFPPLQLSPGARRRFLQSREGFEPVEFAHQVGGGVPAHIRCLSDILRDTYGNPIGVLSVLQDVTPLKELEKKGFASTNRVRGTTASWR